MTRVYFVDQNTEIAWPTSVRVREDCEECERDWNKDNLKIFA